MFLKSQARQLARGGYGLVLLLGLALAPQTSLAQAHETREAGYVVRASIVPSQTFDAASARKHGIKPAANLAVLNVTVSRDGQGVSSNLRAQVSAVVRELTGRKRDIDLRPVVANKMVSYMGTFEFVPHQVLTFEVVATPRPKGSPVTLTFEDKL